MDIQSQIKTMPYSPEAEQAILGAILSSPEKLDEIPFLKPDHFYLEQHQAIYSSMQSLYTNNQTIDYVTVIEALTKTKKYDGADAAKYLKLLIDSGAYSNNITEYANIVKDKALLRSLIDVSRSISDSAFECKDEANVIIDSAEQKIFELSNDKYNGSFTRIETSIKEYFDYLQIIKDDPESLTGQKTYFSDLDSILVGLGAGDLVLIGARPGMGKTTFAMNIACNIAVRPLKDGSTPEIAIFSIEMTPRQLAERMLSSVSLVDNYKLRKGDLSESDMKKLAEAASKLRNTEILIDDTSNIGVTEMKAKLRRLKNLKLVVIDYLQLMSADKAIDNRVLEIAKITRDLKLMAKDLNVPIILCSQLKRDNTGKEGKRPVLSDLRDSGAIEQDADIVLFLHREDYYRTADDKKENESGAEGMFAECIVAKNRHGATGKVTLAWDGAHFRFASVDNVHVE